MTGHCLEPVHSSTLLVTADVVCPEDPQNVHSEKIYAFVRLHPVLVGMVFLILGSILTYIFVPPRFQNATIAVILLALLLVLFWAKTSPLEIQRQSPGQPITIGNYLKKSRLLFIRVMGITCIVWCVAVTFDDQLSRNQQKIAAICGAGILTWMEWLLFRDRLRCPQCGTNFRKERSEKLGRWTMDQRGAEEIWDSCPTCHVSFDSPAPGTVVS